MQISQIKALAESYVDDILEDADAIMWTNECLRQQYADDAEVYGTTQMTAADTMTFYALPADFMGIDAISLADGSDYGGGYHIRTNTIRFSQAGSYTLTYKALPPTVTALSDSPKIHPLLVQTLALWLAMRYKQKDDDENPDANRLRFEFDRQKREQLAVIRRPSNPSVIPIVFGM